MHPFDRMLELVGGVDELASVSQAADAERLRDMIARLDQAIRADDIYGAIAAGADMSAALVTAQHRGYRRKGGQALGQLRRQEADARIAEWQRIADLVWQDKPTKSAMSVAIAVADRIEALPDRLLRGRLRAEPDTIRRALRRQKVGSELP